jgi:hypothetical protein
MKDIFTWFDGLSMELCNDMLKWELALYSIQPLIYVAILKSLSWRKLICQLSMENRSVSSQRKTGPSAQFLEENWSVSSLWKTGQSTPGGRLVCQLFSLSFGNLILAFTTSSLISSPIGDLKNDTKHKFLYTSITLWCKSITINKPVTRCTWYNFM